MLPIPMDEFLIKRGDLAPPLTATLEDLNGPFVIPGDATVVFVLKGPDGVSQRLPAAVIGASAVRWDPVSGDTDVAGKYSGEFEVTSSGKPRTFPLEGFIPVRIAEDLG